jgi:hypothetical protein
MPSPTYVFGGGATSNISPAVVYLTSASTPIPNSGVTYAVAYITPTPTLTTMHVIYIFNIKNHLFSPG